MRAPIVMLALLACAGHGRRVSLPSEHTDINANREHRTSLKAMALLLMASNPVSGPASNPASGPGTRVQTPTIPTPVPATQLKSGKGPTRALKWLIRCVKWPVCMGAVAAVVLGQYRKFQARQLQAKIQLELDTLRKLTLAKSVEPPKSMSNSMQDQREVLAELQMRRTTMQERILPKLLQIYGKSSLKKGMSMGGKHVSKRSSAELDELDASLALRIEASGLLLAEYESIGQPPPRDFQTWPLTKLRAQLDDMAGKRTELRDIVRLYAQLGRQRVDRSVFEWSADELRQHVAELTEQAEEANERKEKMKLLGKVEALLIQRGNDMAVNSLGSLSMAELTALLAKLQGKPPPAAGNIAPGDES